jgi:hypothetical protein
MWRGFFLAGRMERKVQNFDTPLVENRAAARGSFKFIFYFLSSYDKVVHPDFPDEQ